MSACAEIRSHQTTSRDGIVKTVLKSNLRKVNVQVSICPHIRHIPHLHPPTLSYVRWSRKLRTGRPVCYGGSTAEVAADETLKLVSERILDMLARLIQLLGGFDKLGYT